MASFDGLSFQFTRMAEMRHDRQIDPFGGDSLKQPKKIIGIVVCQEFIGPKSQSLGANADGLNIRFVVVGQKGLNVFFKHLEAHDHRVSACKKDVGDLLMLPPSTE
jgi:hypothetical protein